MFALLTPLATQALDFEQEQNRLQSKDATRLQITHDNTGEALVTTVARQPVSLALFGVGIIALIAVRRNRR